MSAPEHPDYFFAIEREDDRPYSILASGAGKQVVGSLVRLSLLHQAQFTGDTDLSGLLPYPLSDIVHPPWGEEWHNNMADDSPVHMRVAASGLEAVAKSPHLLITNQAASTLRSLRNGARTAESVREEFTQYQEDILGVYGIRDRIYRRDGYKAQPWNERNKSGYHRPLGTPPKDFRMVSPSKRRNPTKEEERKRIFDETPEGVAPRTIEFVNFEEVLPRDNDTYAKRGVLKQPILVKRFGYLEEDEFVPVFDSEPIPSL